MMLGRRMSGGHPFSADLYAVFSILFLVKIFKIVYYGAVSAKRYNEFIFTEKGEAYDIKPDFAEYDR